MSRTSRHRAVVLLALTAPLGFAGFGGFDKTEDFVFRSPTEERSARQGERFGAAVAMQSRTIAIGVPGWDLPLPDAGAVVIYDLVRSFRPRGPWEVEQILEAVDPVSGGGFGSRIALDGDTLVTRYGDAGVLEPPPGVDTELYVFTRDAAGLWKLTQRITAPDPDASATFGTAFAVSGDTMAVGAPGARAAPELGTGAIFLYERVGEVWTFDERLDLSDGLLTGDVALGASVDVAGDYLIAGMPELDHAPPDMLESAAAGGARIYERAGATWTVVHELRPPQAVIDLEYTDPDFHGHFLDDGVRFGATVAIDRDVAAVGAPGANFEYLDDEGADVFAHNFGHAYVCDFVSPGAEWAGPVQLPSVDDLGVPAEFSVEDRQFGESLDVDDPYVVVGSPISLSLPFKRGLTQVFRRDGEWCSEQILVDSSEVRDGLGASVAISIPRVLSGNPTAPGAQEGLALLHWIRELHLVRPDPPIPARFLLRPRSVRTLFQNQELSLEIDADVDFGDDEPNLLECAVEYGDQSVAVTAWKELAGGKLGFTTGDGLVDVVLTPPRDGSSKGRLRLIARSWKGLQGQAQEDLFPLTLKCDGQIAQSFFEFANQEYRAGAGIRTAPLLFATALKAKIKKPGKHSFKFSTDFAGGGVDPGFPEPPTITVRVGHPESPYSVSAPTTLHLVKQKKPGVYVYKRTGLDKRGKAPGGIWTIKVDFLKNTIKVVGRNVDLGEFDLGSAKLLIGLGINDEEHAIEIHASNPKGKQLIYR